jgi:uncharacterized Zn finger protein
MGWYSFRPYVPVAARRHNAAKEIAKLQKKGRVITPVVLEKSTIARSFWGKAWCTNLEAYSDFANRLPRGRTYVRNGSVVDLQISAGKVTALVSGSDLYRIEIAIAPAPKNLWTDVKRRCAGQIGSLIELLQGKFSDSVMQVMTAPESGLFPRPDEIKLDCSCPDWADMCKHVAAALYGVGARLDRQPELLFTLRQVDHLELLAQAGAAATLTPTGNAPAIDEAQLSEVFGIELEPAALPPPQPIAKAKKTPRKPTPVQTDLPAKFKAIKISKTSTPRKQTRSARPHQKSRPTVTVQVPRPSTRSPSPHKYNHSP